VNDLTTWDALGWLGNLCFFLRFVVQWWRSERASRSVAPPSFWHLSLVGTGSLGAYAWHCANYVLVAGYSINALIYARNLRLRSTRRGMPLGVTLVLAALAAAVLVGASALELELRADSAPLWIAVAFLGQTLWSARFLVQWLHSERASASHFPRAFWWLSLAGNALLLAFAVHLRDPKFIVGFAFGPLVQVRNLMLTSRRAACAME
jgi:lipid-A-disaccharide synthase-like uncharacterized protein